MKSKNIPAIVIIVVLLAVLGGMAIAAQDRFTLKAVTSLSKLATLSSPITHLDTENHSRKE